MFSLFEAKIRKINEEKLAELEEKLISEFNLAKVAPAKEEAVEVLD